MGYKRKYTLNPTKREKKKKPSRFWDSTVADLTTP